MSSSLPCAAHSRVPMLQAMPFLGTRTTSPPLFVPLFDAVFAGIWAIGRNLHEYMETQTCGRRRSGDSGAEAKRGMSAYLCAYRGALA